MASTSATLIRMGLASLVSAGGGGAVTALVIALLSHDWPPVATPLDALTALLVVPLWSLGAAFLGAFVGMFIATPWTALVGTLLLTFNGRLMLRSVLPWLGAGLLGGIALGRLTPWRDLVLDQAGEPLVLAGGALGGMAAGWLFRRTWLAAGGEEANDIPTF